MNNKRLEQKVWENDHPYFTRMNLQRVHSLLNTLDSFVAYLQMYQDICGPRTLRLYQLCNKFINDVCDLVMEDVTGE